MGIAEYRDTHPKIYGAVDNENLLYEEHGK